MKKILLIISIIVLAFSVNFVYGNPDSATLDDPTDDGVVSYDTYSEEYTKDTTEYRIGYSYSYDYIGRMYIEWDISSIPDGATITNVVFKYEGYSNSIDCHIHECKGVQPSDISDGTNAVQESLYNELGEGIVYADPAGFPVVAHDQEVNLGATAISDLQAQLSVDWFAIGIQSDNEESDDLSEIATEEWGVQYTKPTLYVEYSMLEGWAHKWNTKEISKWNTKEIMKWNGIE